MNFNAHSLPELDALLGRIEQDARDSLQLKIMLSQVNFRPAKDQFDISDPFSTAYRDQVLETFHAIRRQQYNVLDEGIQNQDVHSRARWATPFGSPPSLVGDHLIAFGLIMKVMGETADRRVLEVGCGEGSLSYSLAKAGFHLTSLDASSCSVNVTRAHLEPLRVPGREMTVLCQDIQTFEPTRKFDVIIFFESFHHILDHDAVLGRMADNLTENGSILLGAEAIYDRQSQTCPYPWGMRLDGESLRAIRNFGWMELGFTRPYFDRLLRRHDLKGEIFVCKGSTMAHVVKISKSTEGQAGLGPDPRWLGHRLKQRVLRRLGLGQPPKP